MLDPTPQEVTPTKLLELDTPPTIPIHSEYEDVIFIRKMHQLVASDDGFAELALLQDYLVSQRLSPQMTELVTTGMTRVMAMLFAFNGNTAMKIMNYMSNTDLLVPYLREHPEEWKLIQDGIRSVILGSDVLSQMLESDVGA
jgi:predicted lipase